MQIKLDLINIDIQSFNANWLPENVLLDILRLDKIHHVVSGNKWFKLKHYLIDAGQNGYEEIATFGGAYSNHIVAAAFACKAFGFKSTGVIRGEKPSGLSTTLQQAIEYGMDLQFVSREAFKNKEHIKQKFADAYWINEGGYGPLGATGAGEIMSLVPGAEKYSHIVCAVGTGTMFAGIVNSIKPGQKIVGVSVLKNNFSIKAEVEALLHDKTGDGRFEIAHDFHFGGYAKHPPALLDFMKHVWYANNLPTDIVYTSKTLYATQQMIMQKTIPPGSRVLMIHSGGLQGNSSLQKGFLPF